MAGGAAVVELRRHEDEDRLNKQGRCRVGILEAMTTERFSVLGCVLVFTVGCGSSPAAETGGRDASDLDVTTNEGGAEGGLDSPVEAAPDAGCAPTPRLHEAGAPITVGGTVFTSDGYPFIVNVTIEGHTTTSADDGTFSIAGVTPPYDVRMDDPGLKYTETYLGLTRPDPSLVLSTVEGNSAPMFRRQVVAGTLTLGGVAIDAGAAQLAGTLIDTSSAPNGNVIGFAQTTGSFQEVAVWTASPTAQATLWGYEANVLPTGGVASFTAVGSQTFTLDGGADLTGVNLAIAPANVTATSLSGSVTMPVGCTGLTAGMSMGRGLQEGIYLGTDTVPADAGSFAYGTFSSPLTWTLQVSCSVNLESCGLVRAGLVGNENLTLDIPSPVSVVVTPILNTSVPHGCEQFSWTPTPNSIYVASIQGSGGSPNYTVVLDGTSFLSPYAIPPGTYMWSLYQIAPVASIDALAASYAAGSVISTNGPGADHAGCTTFFIQFGVF